MVNRGIKELYGAINRDDVESLVGELVMLIPLILFSIAMGQVYSIVMALITFMIAKWQYDKPLSSHFHIQEEDCIKLTYTVFILIGLVYAGVQYVFPLGRQPIIPILISLFATFVWAVLGDLMADNRDLQAYKDSKESEPPFTFKTATEDEIRHRCARKGLDNEDIDLLVRMYKTKTTYKEYASEFYVTEQAIKKRKQRLTRRVLAD